MELKNNQAILKVALNHKDEKRIRNNLFNVYTLTDLASGKNFDVWSIPKIEFLEKMNLLTELKSVLFSVIVDDSKIKLRPIIEIK